MHRLWRLLAAHRDYRLLLTAGLVSLTGDWVLTIGLTFSVYALTGSTLASGAMVLAAFAPQLLGSLAGVFVDRWNRKITMVVTDVLLAVGLLPLLLVHDASRVWIVYLVALWESSVEQFFTPAERAAVPHLVDEDELVAANGANGQIQGIARLVGSALGGVAAGFGGLTAVAVVDGASFLVSAGLLVLIRALPKAPERGEVRQRLAAVGQEWRAGIQVVLRKPLLRLIFVFLAVTSIGEGVVTTLFAPFLTGVLHAGAAAYGVILALQAVGGIAGGLAVAAYGHRWSPRTLVGVGAVLFGGIDLLLFLYPLVGHALWPAGVLITVVGIPGAAMVAGYTSTLQAGTDDRHRGRVFGAVATTSGATSLIGIAAAGLLGGVLGVVPVIAIQGVAYVLAGVLVVIALRLPGNGQGTDPVDDGERAERDLLERNVEPQGGEAVEQGRVADAHLHPGQGRAETVVDAVAEGQVRGDGPGQVHVVQVLAE
jgi:Na+/melibiose symporter-like transporter